MEDDCRFYICEFFGGEFCNGDHWDLENESHEDKEGDNTVKDEDLLESTGRNRYLHAPRPFGQVDTSM